MQTLGLIFLIIFLTVIPLALGIPWHSCNIVNGKWASLGYSYLMGYFVMLSVFELVFFPAAYFGIRFNVVSIVYSILIFILSIGSVLYSNKNGLLKSILQIKEQKWIKYDVVYLAVFFALFFLQVYYALFYSRTYMADDGYIAFSSSTLADNYINMTSVYSGIYSLRDATWISRIIQEINFYPAYLSFVSSINPVVIDHTIIYLLVLVLAYLTYYLISSQMFDKRENRLLFLIFVSIIYIWGFHSHYSVTFRLLGPNSEGKAILAVVLDPFLFCVMYRIVEVGYQKRIGILLLMLSIVSCCLSLGGVYNMVAIVLAMVVISAVKNRTVKVTLYFVWGFTIPALFAGIYVYYRFRWG